MLRVLSLVESWHFFIICYFDFGTHRGTNKMTKA